MKLNEKKQNTAKAIKTNPFAMEWPEKRKLEACLSGSALPCCCGELAVPSFATLALLCICAALLSACIIRAAIREALCMAGVVKGASADMVLGGSLDAIPV